MKKSAACDSFHPSRSDAAALLAIVGHAKMARLQEALGGRRIWIPKPGARLVCHACERRDECVAAWRAQGRSAVEIARYLGLSHKTVYRACARAHKKGRRSSP